MREASSAPTLPQQHPDAAGQSADGRRPGAHRRGAAGARRHADGAGHRRGARGHAALGGRHSGAPGAPAAAARARVRAAGRRAAHRRAHRPARRGGHRRARRRGGGRPDHLRLGRAGPAASAAPTAVFSPTIDEVVRDAPCNIAVVKQRGVKDVERILAPVRGGPHAELALAFAGALGRYFEAAVDVMHVVPPDIDAGRPRPGRARPGHVRRAPRRRSGAAAAGRGHEHRPARSSARRTSAQLVVMGAAAMTPTDVAQRRGRALRRAARDRRPAGAADGHRRQDARAARSRQTFEQRAEQAETLEAADRAAEPGRSVPARVDRWFAESNYHHREFGDLGRLVALKEQQGLTISAVLPTLNEAATIGADRPRRPARADGEVRRSSTSCS